MTPTRDLNVAIERMVRAVLESARADSTINIKLARVMTAHAPEMIVGADGQSSMAWPASVDVEIVPWSTRIVAQSTHKLPGETVVQNVAGGLLVAGKEDLVRHVPIMFPGGEGLALTEMPSAGQLGFLFLTGKHHGRSISTGETEIPRLIPSVERNSDALFVPGFIVGALAALLPPGAQPSPGSAPQLAPRSAESEIVHVRYIPGGWVFGGTDLRLGGEASSRPASGVGDTVTFSASMLTWIGLVSTATGVAPPVDPTSEIATGASTVKLPNK